MFGEVIHCVTRRKPRVLESRMQRVRMERRELHPASENASWRRGTRRAS